MIGLNETCTIKRATETLNEYGEPELAWSDVATGVKCRYVTGSYYQREQLRAVAGAGTIVAEAKILLPGGMDIQEGDRIELDSRLYEVLSAEDVDRVGYVIEVQVARIEGVTA